MASYQPGNYIGEILGHGISEPTEYGTQLVVKVLPAQYADGSYVDNPQERTVYLSLLDKDGNMDKWGEKTVEVLHALGYYEPVGRLAKDSPNPFSLVGTEVQLACAHKPNNSTGKVNERWYINTGAGGPKYDPATPKTLSRLDAIFGAAMKKGRPPAGTAAPQPPKRNANAGKPVERDAKPLDFEAETAAAEADPNRDIPF